MRKKKMNKLEKKRFIEDLELIVAIIGLFLIYAVVCSLFKIGMNYLIIIWIIIGMITLIYKFILQRKLK